MRPKHTDKATEAALKAAEAAGWRVVYPMGHWGYLYMPARRMRDSMTTHEFDLILTGLDLERDADRLGGFETQLADITLASHGGVVRAAVERRARTLAEAIRSAAADLEEIPGVSVVRVEPDEHVSQVEIASRLGRSRQSVSQLISGSRGPGGFPAPAIRSGHVMLWRWTDVSQWARRADIAVSESEERHAAIVRAANALLEARRAVCALDEDERASLENLVA